MSMGTKLCVAPKELVVVQSAIAYGQGRLQSLEVFQDAKTGHLMRATFHVYMCTSTEVSLYTCTCMQG